MKIEKYSRKFWFIFWASATILLMSFYLWLHFSRTDEVVANGRKTLSLGEKYEIISGVMEYLLSGEKEKTFLILFQNNMEIRPGGGFIGSFGILKLRNGMISDLKIHDTGYFDERIPDTIKAPYPMEENLRVKYLKLRDSNFSPDFPTNAKSAEDFYSLGKGEEKFDGVVAITTNVLTSFLKVVGPVTLEGYPGTYADENAVLALEYQVEKAFDEQGIDRRERKSVMNILASEVLNKVKKLELSGKIELLDVILDDLRRKDIQLFFRDQQMQQVIDNAFWNGKMDTEWKKDYLMAVDANLGAWKSDYYIKREMKYTIDLSGGKPIARLKITYNHTATQKDYMTKDYFSYLRVYVPNGAWLANAGDFSNPQFGKEILVSGKSRDYFGVIVKVPISTSRSVELVYSLPENMAVDYALKLQKQAGINNEPIKMELIEKNGNKKEYQGILENDFIWR